MALVGAYAPADEPQHLLRAGRVEVAVEPWKGGVSISVDGVVVSGGSRMVVTTPPWAPHYYLGPSREAVASAKQEAIEGGVRLRMSHRGQGDAFVGEEVITVTEDGRVERVLDGHFTPEEGEALIQWQVAALNPMLIIGRPYQVSLANGELRRGIVPVVAESSDASASTLARGFEWIEFDSRIGPIRVEVDSDRQLICYDYRKSRWADPRKPLFWLGDLGTRFGKDQPLRYRVVVRLPALAKTYADVPPVQACASIERVENAQTYPVEDRPTLIPRPKQAEFSEGGFVLWPPPLPSSSRTVALIQPEEPHAGLANLAIAELRRSLKERFDIESFRCAPDAVDRGIRFEVLAADAAPVPSEGYDLIVSPEGIVLRAADAPGFFHAVQTLKQLIAVRPTGETIVRAATIRDWPSLRFRGVHMFTGGQGPELHIKLIRNVIAALKMNRLVLESEYVEWDSHPEIHHPERGMPKHDVRRILAVCREQGIEVIPLVMSLGHCQWMFTNDQNLELAEDPDAKWAYCVTNPKTYDFIFEIYGEALELFQPKWFHIGHDEFTHRGRYPYRESSKPYSAEELLMMDVTRLHNWFTQRGVRVMMWGDMLLGPGEAPDACDAASVESAAALREQLPEDIIIADWHYAAARPEAFVNLDKFYAARHETVAATWFRPGNTVNYAKAAYEKKSLGLLQTTWAGYSFDPESFEREMHQYAAYVLAAEAAWNADNPPDSESFPAGTYFLDLMGLSSLRPANRAGWTTDLRSACNYPLAAKDDQGWFGLGRDHDLSQVPGGQVRFKGLTFNLANLEDRLQPAAIVLRSKLTATLPLPTEVEIGLGEKAAQLAILHATNFACEADAKVGEYQVTYADGQVATIDVIYGRNILSYTDLKAVPEAPIVWTGATKAGEPVALRVLIWDNPCPDEPIRALTARSAGATGSLMVLGLTGLHPDLGRARLSPSRSPE
jgi:hexosaminidase